MKTQQAAEREEQQRIKNLVLNYDLREVEEQDGDSLLNPLPRSPNIYNYNSGLEKAAAMNHAKPDKSSNNRSGQRARKLQISDIDWYADDSSRTQAIIHQDVGSGSKAVPSKLQPAIPLTLIRPPNSAGSDGKVTKLPKHTRQQARQTPVVVKPTRIRRKDMLAEHASRIPSLNSLKTPLNSLSSGGDAYED